MGRPRARLSRRGLQPVRTVSGPRLMGRTTHAGRTHRRSSPSRSQLPFAGCPPNRASSPSARPYKDTTSAGCSSPDRSPTMTAKYTLLDIDGGMAVEEFLAPIRLTREEAARQLNVAYFCGRCGNVWARFNNGARFWRGLSRPCPTCPSDNLDVPGSLLFPWEEDNLAGLPAGMLARELLLLMNRQLENDFADTIPGRTPVQLPGVCGSPIQADGESG